MSSKKPNILWICSDQQRFDSLGCYGNRFVKTPNIDALARDGVLFESAFAQSPVCTPSRASFLTGRYPRTTRCRQNGQTIPADEKFVPRLLKDAVNYTCGLSGKLHTSYCSPTVLKGTEHRIDDGYDEFNWSHDPDPSWSTNQYINWLTSKGAQFHTPKYKDSRQVREGMSADLHQTTWCAEKAINFIKLNAAFDEPWLFSVNMFDPHHAFDPPVAYLEKYLERLDDIPLPNYMQGELNAKPLFQRMDHRHPYNGQLAGEFPSYDDMTDYDHRLLRAAYWAMIDLIDEQVGRLLKTLDDTGQRDNTLVIFMSDHGEMLGDHGIYLKGPYFYEPAIHVPLILNMPGTIPGGVRSDVLVELVDLAPTLLEAAGVQRYQGMQGRSLWKQLTGTALPDTPREDIYCEYYNAMPWHQNPNAQATMVRTKTHKLVVVHGTDEGELYDLTVDLGETTNLWSGPTYADVKSSLLRRLCDRMAWTVDPLPPRIAAW